MPGVGDVELHLSKLLIFYAVPKKADVFLQD